jgi:DNA polymerase elongation subunit (family B)
MSTRPTLVFDIETVGEDFGSLDKVTQDVLTRWIKKESESEEEYKIALEELKNGLGFSPLTGEIVAIGVLDADKNEGAVYFQAPGASYDEIKENGIAFRALTEKEMLQRFWEVAMRYEVFVTFNGRVFDAPFLFVRSAVHGIKPSKDLMRGRYFSQQDPRAVHIDLLDQLTFYGATRKKGGLHLWARAFGIESPKGGGVTGDDVGPLFRQKKYLEIAKYNVGDLRATKALYEKWDKYIRM